MARPPNPGRDKVIADALAAGETAKSVAALHGISIPTVYRAAERFAAQPTQTKTPATRSGTAQAGAMQPIVQARRTITSYDLQGKARTGLKRFGGTIYDDYDRTFITLNKRVALYREMGDDPVAAAVLQACKMTLRRLSVYAESEGDTPADEQAVEFLEQCWADMSQSATDTIDQAANCLQYGFAPAEVVYKKRQGDQHGRMGDVASSKYDDGKIGWRKWLFMAPDTLQPGNEWKFDATGGVQGLNQIAAPDYTVVHIPIEKMVLFTTTGEKANPEGRSLFRAMYRSWYFKNNLEEIEAISGERMGAGLPVVYLGEGTQRAGIGGDDLDTFKDIIRNIRVDEQMGVVIPYQKQDAATGRGVLLELLSPTGAVVDYNQTIVRHEQRMAMVGLAQFIHLGMQNVGAKSQNESSQDFFTLAVSAWADSILDTINRYAVERLFAFNYFPGLTAIPKLSHEAVAQIHLPSIAEYINSLVGAQLITPSEELERYLLELVDLPITPKLTELWEAKDKLKEEQQQLGLEGQKAAIENAGKEPVVPGKPKPNFSKNADVSDAELLAALADATEALRASPGELEIDEKVLT